MFFFTLSTALSPNFSFAVKVLSQLLQGNVIMSWHLICTIKLYLFLYFCPHKLHNWNIPQTLLSVIKLISWYSWYFHCVSYCYYLNFQKLLNFQLCIACQIFFHQFQFDLLCFSLFSCVLATFGINSLNFFFISSRTTNILIFFQ